MLTLGLAAPLRWGRRRIALRVRATQVNDAGSFPDMAAVSRWFAPSLSAPWAELQRELAAQGIVTTVFGSHGWQQMTGLAYLHKGSDLDLLVQVADPTTADRAAGLLSACGFVHPRLDGELLFPFGHVAWREWQRWRNGLTASILVKHRSRAVLEHGEGWLAAARTTGPLAP